MSKLPVKKPITTPKAIAEGIILSLLAHWIDLYRNNSPAPPAAAAVGTSARRR